MSSLVQIMAWRWTGDKPLSDSMMAQFTDAFICVNELTAITVLGLHIITDFFDIDTNTDTTFQYRYQCAGLGSIPFFQFNSNSVIFNSIPIPLFSIPIPIPLLAISFNSNSNSRDFNSNSNSNSGDLKSRQARLEKWPVDVSLEIDYNYMRYMYIKLL